METGILKRHGCVLFVLLEGCPLSDVFQRETEGTTTIFGVPYCEIDAFRSLNGTSFVLFGYV